MAVLRFANLSYFSDGNWERDLALGKEPILIDPKWEATPLAQSLISAPEQIHSTVADDFWIATSGSSGHPKLIRKSRAQIRLEANFWKDHLETALDWSWQSIEQFVVSVPLCHLYGLIWGYELPKILNRPVLYLDLSSSQTIVFKDEDLLVSIPYSLKKWKEKNTPLPKRIISSGSKFPVPLAQSFRSEGKVDIREIYGSTETGAMGARNPMWKARFKLLPMVNAKTISIEDADVLQVQSEFISNESLELKIEGDDKAVWKKTDLKEPDDYFTTNDSGDLSEIGWNLFGRIDRITKVKGKRISLDTIESMIGALQNVIDVAVVSFIKEDDQKIGCMVNTEYQTSELEEILRSTIPISHIPAKIVNVNAIPKLSNGKTDYLAVLKDFT